MSSSAARKSLIFAVPVLVLAAAGIFLPRLGGLDPAHRELVMAAPYLVTAAGLFLAVHFHRGRPLLALLLLSLYYWGCRTGLAEGVSFGPARAVYLAFVYLLPVNLALVAVMRERGILTPAGRARVGVIAAQALVALWLFRYRLDGLEPFFTVRLTSLLPDRMLLPQTALVLALAAIGVSAACALRRGSPVDGALAGAQTAFLVAAIGVASPEVTAVFCAAGALTLTLGILQDSYNMAFRDDLTGIPSRRALNESLHGMGRRCAIAMVDVDHFKKFNDSYGHDVGDQVLRMVAAKVRAVGGGGKGYRYGGEEFTVVFPGRTVADAVPHLEELRTAIAGYRLQLRGSDRPRDARAGSERRGTRSEGLAVSVTVSIGVADSSDGHGAVTEIIKAADRALYKAKHQGRNMVCR